MGRPVRHVSPTHYYLLTNRCTLGTYLLRPDEETRRIIKGCLARAADRFDIELVCFVFLSNHFHLIARFPHRNMAEFMEQFQGQLASRINDHRDRAGPVFPERYDDEILLGTRALEDKIGYVLNNPLHHGLVGEAAAWPGVSSFDLHDSGDPLVGEWLNGRTWTQLRRRQGDYDRQEAMDSFEVELHLPEELGGAGPVADGGQAASRRARRDRLLEIVREDRRRVWAERTGACDRPPPGLMSPEALLQVDWRDRPDESPRSGRNGRRLAAGSEGDALCAYETFRRELTEEYRALTEQWRSGKEVEPGAYPAGTYPPACRHCVGSRRGPEPAG